MLTISVAQLKSDIAGKMKGTSIKEVKDFYGTAQSAAAPEVSKFLNEINTKVLQIMSDGQAFRCLVNQVANPPQGTLECHFIKTSKEEIKADNMVSQLLVSTIRGSSVLALHSYISTIYTPILFGDIEEGSK